MKNKCKMKRIVVKVALAMLAVSLCVICASCRLLSSDTEYVSRSYLMMDTVIEIKLQCDREVAAPVFDRCGEIMTDIEQALSRTLPESTVSQFNAAGKVTPDAETAAVLRMALEISDKTDGAFDPTVEGVVSLWDTCAAENRLPTEAEMRERLAHVGAEKLILSEDVLTRADPDTTIDLGAIGKGYAIDRVVAYLESTDIPGGVVSFGGNIAVFGAKQSGEPYRIGLRDPQNTTGVVGYLQMPSGVISVSGDYERYVSIGGERYHHILDPATGYPTTNGLHSVAVICENGALADALSTALFVMGKERAMAFYRAEIYDFEAIFVTDDAVLLTDGLASSDRFELASDRYALIP